MLRSNKSLALVAEIPGRSPPPAPPGVLRRLASMLYESLLLLGVFASMVLLPHTIYAMNSGQPAPSWMLACHSLMLLAAYFIWFWRHGGQTLAMKTWRIRMENALTNGPITPFQGLLRFMLCWPSLFFFGAGIIWAIFDRDRQFLHDRIAGTRLINAVPPTRSSMPPPPETSHSA